MSYREGETGERGKGQWLWKLPVVDLVDDIKDTRAPIKDAKGCQNIDGGILNHTEGIEEPKFRLDKPDSLRMPPTGNEPIKDANLIKDARVPTIGDVGTLNHDETETIEDANSGILKECIHGLGPDSCKVCNGYVRQLIEGGAAT